MTLFWLVGCCSKNLKILTSRQIVVKNKLTRLSIGWFLIRLVETGLTEDEKYDKKNLLSLLMSLFHCL